MNIFKLAELYSRASRSTNWYAAELSRKCDQYLEGFITFEELLHNVHELTDFIERKENASPQQPPQLQDLSDVVYEGAYEENDEYGSPTMRSLAKKWSDLELKPEYLRGRPDYEPETPEESEAHEHAKYLDEIEAPEPLKTNWSEESTEPASEELKEFVEQAFELYVNAQNTLDYLVNEDISVLRKDSYIFKELNTISEQINENHEYTDDYSCHYVLNLIEKYFNKIEALGLWQDELEEGIYNSVKYEFEASSLIDEMKSTIKEIADIAAEFRELKNLQASAAE